MLDFSSFQTINKVIYLTEEDCDFSEFYLKVRQKEQRILSDKDILKLPNLNRYEWPLRIKSTKRFTDYISAKKNNLQILDIGCGNGWFTNKMSSVSKHNTVIGLDVNRVELEQASRLFNHENIHFIYADIFDTKNSLKEQFDVITLNGSIQYFKDFETTVELLKTFLKPKGELHIIDSPFYKVTEIENAKARTKVYYESVGIPEMIKNYHHHSTEQLHKFDILYSFKRNLTNKLLGKKDSPFSWFRIIK